MNERKKSFAFGIINKEDQNLPPDQLIEIIEKSIDQYSYDPEITSDFLEFFRFIVRNYEHTTDLELLTRAITALANIGGYRCGITVAKVFPLVTPISIRLLSGQNVTYIKAVVDFYRKIGRVIGPRYIIKIFIEPNVGKVEIQRDLAIIARQCIVDSPNFEFQPEDFSAEWVEPLANVISVGPRLVQSIRQRVGDLDTFVNFNENAQTDHITSTPTSPSPTFNPKKTTTFSNKNPLVRTLPSIPQISPRFGLSRPNTQNPTFQLTKRQQQIREFNDSQFEADENLAEIVQMAKGGILSKEWDDRCSAYNLSRRILKYSPNSLTDEDVHTLVTSILDDVSGARAALSLASIGALQELFVFKCEIMELELARVLPVLLRLHAKTAQFFEAALFQCCEVIVKSIPSKRFVSVLLTFGDSKAAKVQAAIAKYYDDSIVKCFNNKERFFSKSSDELVDLIKMMNLLCNGSTHPTREAARNSVRYLSLIIGEDFQKIARKVLSDRDANSLFQNM